MSGRYICCKHKNKSCAWAADNFSALDTAFLLTVLQYNKPSKAKNNYSTSVYYLLCVKWNFIFALRKSGPAKTGLAGLVATALILFHKSI